MTIKYKNMKNKQIKINKQKTKMYEKQIQKHT